MKDRMIDTLQERFAEHAVDVPPTAWDAISGQLALANGTVLSQAMQQKFTGHEMEVDPHIWENISSQLGHGAAAGVSATTGWMLGGIAATLLAGGLYFWSTTESPAPTPEQETATPLVVPEAPANTVAALPAPQETALTVQDPATATGTPRKQASGLVPVKAPIGSNPTESGNPEQVTTMEPPPTPEGEKTVNTVLQDIVDNYVTSPIVVVTEKKVPPPTQEEMPSEAVRIQHEEPAVADNQQEDQELPEVGSAPQLSVMIPTAFSPNGDGVNDELEVTVRNYQKAIVRIFSASSNALVFSADNLEARWNGRMMNTGQPCEAGMYFYALEVTDAEGRAWSKGEVIRLFPR